MSRPRSTPAWAFSRLLTGLGVAGVARATRTTRVFAPGWVMWVGSQRPLGPDRTMTNALEILESERVHPDTKVAVVLQKHHEIEMAQVTLRAEDFAALLVAAQVADRHTRTTKG